MGRRIAQSEAILLVYDQEIHLETFTQLEIGDMVGVIRGNGPREGDRMGTATVAAFGGGAPVLDVRFDGAPVLEVRLEGAPR